MRVEVRLYAMLRRYAPGEESPLMLTVAEGARVRSVLETLGIPDDEEKVMLLNGRPAAVDDPLREGDRLVLFPPVAGG